MVILSESISVSGNSKVAVGVRIDFYIDEETESGEGILKCLQLIRALLGRLP